MNKLITTDSGGYPFVLDDLRFVDEAVREGLKGNLNFLGDGFIMDSIKTDITAATSWSFPETFAVLNGEILRIPALTVNSSPAVGKWYILELDSTFTGTTPGLKTFLDASSNETYNVRKGKLTLQTTSLVGGEIVILNGKTAKWEYKIENTYTYRLSVKIGMDAVKVVADAAALDADEALTKIADINAGWESLNGSSLLGCLKINASAVPSHSSGFGGAPLHSTNYGVNFNTTNSDIRYKIIGDNLFLNYKILGVALLDYASYPTSAILLDLDLIGLMGAYSSIVDFETIGAGVDDVAGGCSGTTRIINHPNLPGTLHITLDPVFRSSGSSKLSFNKKHTFDAATLVLTATGDTATAHTWDLRGQLMLSLV